MGTKTRKLSNIVDSIVQWQAVKTADFTAVAGEGYFIDTSSNTVTATLPASASLGDEINIVVTTSGNTTTIGRNGHNIDGSASDQNLAADGDSKRYVYVNASEGWKTFQSTVAPTFISATGGTETTSGDFKIHTFTSSGCFTVSSTSNTDDNNDVSYLVIAGGGGAGGGTPGGSDYEGGGGGAGGFREGKSSVDDYTASPLNAPAGITVTATTYPITVGAGGSGSDHNCCRGISGSNSVFSTITSAGGGGGGSRNTAVQPGLSGGSGGGGGQGDTGNPYPVVSNIAQNFGSGNTPPVSPSQGNPGGGATVAGSPASSGGGGGGGAGGAGGDAGYPNAIGGNGANGATSSITGSPVTRAGGGGGSGTSPSGGLGGPGGGGNGGAPARGRQGGTANTGGGGGATGSAIAEASGSGGSGVVIIRYKYQ